MTGMTPERAHELLTRLVADLSIAAGRYHRLAQWAGDDDPVQPHYAQVALLLDALVHPSDRDPVERLLPPEPPAEPEPREVTLEWSEVEPDPDPEDGGRIPEHIWRQAITRAVRRHLAGRGRRQHRYPVDQIPSDWEGVRHLHDINLPHGKRDADHSDVIDEAREIARELLVREQAAREREQKAGAR